LFKWMISGRSRSKWGKIARDGSWQHKPAEPAAGSRGSAE
jgi:hypothetical protein